MMLLTAAKAAAAAVAGSLAFSSGRNMLQTYSIAKKHASDPSRRISTSGDHPTTVKEIQSLPRHELLRLYLYTCEPPADLSEIDGDWNGVLLDNGSVLTRVSGFITNRLFGKGRRWNGKSFDAAKLTGNNRFETFAQSNDRLLGRQKITVVSRTEDDQRFDFALRGSRLRQKSGSGKAVVTDYSVYSGRLSPWRGMVDEVRVVPPPPGTAAAATGESGSDKCEMLLGLGCLGWSGGMLNAQPFCLYRRRRRRSNPLR